MKITQVSIFLENRSGRIADVLAVLAGANINIRALSLADTQDFGILRLMVDRPDDALAALKAAHYTAIPTAVLAVEVPDAPGGLHSILSALSSQNLNVEYMYAFVGRKTEKALVVFRFDDPIVDDAIKALLAAGISVLGPDDVKSI